MKRREFIRLLGVSTAAWPLTVRAQSNTKARRVGLLANEKWPPIEGLRDGLRALGYVEGQNLDFLPRYVEGDAGRYATLAAELVRLPVDVIVTCGTPASLAAKQATNTIPTIMIRGEPRRRRPRPRPCLPGRQHHWSLYPSRRA
jgi:putative ABC transport system substrate-binding protein